VFNNLDEISNFNFLYKSHFEGKILPLDKKKLYALLKEIKRLDDEKVKIKHSIPKQTVRRFDEDDYVLKKSLCDSSSMKWRRFVSYSTSRFIVS